MSAFDGYTLIGPLCYRGKQGCENVTCTHHFDPATGQFEDRCYGWHCSYCDAPCSSQGHRCDAANAILDEASRLAAGLPPQPGRTRERDPRA